VVQDAIQRPCPGCGAENQPAAAFCWRCYARFGGVAGFGGPRPVPLPPPPAWPVGSEVAGARPKRSNAGLISAVVVGVSVAATLVAVGAPWARGPMLPDSAAGFSRMHTPGFDEYVSEAKKQPGAPADLDADADLYGSAGAPRLAVMWLRSSDMPDAEGAFMAMASGLMLPPGSRGLKTFTRDGQALLCGLASDVDPNSPAIGLCAWPDGKTMWAVYDLELGNDLDATADLSAQVRADIEG